MHLESFSSLLSIRKPLRTSRTSPRSQRRSRHLILVRLHAHRSNGRLNLHHRNQGHKSHLVLLLARKTLSVGYGGRDKSVSHIFPAFSLNVPHLMMNRPASGQTLADYQSRAAQAPENITPQSPNTGNGQIGGTSPTTQPAGVPAAQSTKSDASVAFRISSWSLGLVAVVAWMAL